MLGAIIGPIRLKCEMKAFTRWICMLLLSLSPFGLVWIGIFDMNMQMQHMIGVQLAFVTPIIAFLIAGIILSPVPGWKGLGTSMVIFSAPFTIALLAGFIKRVPYTEFATGGCIPWSMATSFV